MRPAAFSLIMLSLIFLAISASAYGREPVASVTVRPDFLNAVQYGAVTGSIMITTDRPGDFSVSISGVPAGWLDYEKEVSVDSARTVSYFIRPLEAGSYTLHIRVAGSGGTREMVQSLWVERRQPGESVPSDGIGAFSGTGFMTLNYDTSLLSATAVVILSIITAAAAYFYFRDG